MGYEIVIRDYSAGAPVLDIAVTGARAPGGQAGDVQSAEDSDRQADIADSRASELGEGHSNVAHRRPLELGRPTLSLSFARSSPQVARDVAVHDDGRLALTGDDRDALTLVHRAR